MVKLELNTTVTGGDLDSFQAAFSRSVLGVTYKKFKRKGKPFYETRSHNEDITKKGFEYLYLTLREKYQDNLKNYSLRVNYTIEWDNNGKILGFYDLTVNMYFHFGKLSIDELELKRKKEIINIDLFYSDFDAGSKKVKSSLPKILNEFGHDKFIISEYNYSNENHKNIAKTYNIELIPTIRIDEIKIENPSENQIRDAITKSLDQKIVPSGLHFNESKEAMMQLSQILENY